MGHFRSVRIICYHSDHIRDLNGTFRFFAMKPFPTTIFNDEPPHPSSTSNCLALSFTTLLHLVLIHHHHFPHPPSPSPPLLSSSISIITFHHTTNHHHSTPPFPPLLCIIGSDSPLNQPKYLIIHAQHFPQLLQIHL